MIRESDNFILNNPTSEKLDQIKDIVNNKILSFDNTLDTFYNRCLKPRFYNKLF